MSLENRDYVLIVDKSGSMTSTDTANGKSRWQYARESTEAIARKTAEFDPDGITVIPFSGQFKVYENTTPDRVAQIWKEQEPMGGTVLAPVLRQVFTNYITRKKQGQTKAGGEMLLIVTDGQPQDEKEVAQEIIKFANQLENPDSEYGISFIQVGRDTEATAFLKRLDDDLVKQGAKHDIVDTKTMDEVEALGLTETLMAALND